MPGCTISREIYGGAHSITYYSMAEHTDISAEIYPYHKLFLVAAGEMTVYTSEGTTKTHSGHRDQMGATTLSLSEGDIIVAPTDIPVGVRTDKSVIFTEISIPKNENMNQAIKAGEVFTLVQLVPYQEGRIVNMDVVSNSKMKFVVMSFDAGTGLSEHAAPGEALIFALDGEAVIGYEGSVHHITAGEQFHFAKGGLHSVKAIKQFKMALLLTLK